MSDFCKVATFSISDENQRRQAMVDLTQNCPIPSEDRPHISAMIE
jgi:hypothetical protein